MSILVGNNTRLVVQGITGREGRFHARRMKAYGTAVVAGVSPGKEGITVEGTPVFNSVERAVERTGANTSIVFVPPPFAAEAIVEAATAGVALVVVITEGIPVRDMIRILPVIKRYGTRLIGPNCPGIITPGVSLIGIMPGDIFTPGRIGVISRSGTLTYEVVSHLTQHGFGQTTCVGIGGDPVAGLYYLELLKMFEGDPSTDAVVLIGEIGGDAEEGAATFIAKCMTTPVVAFIAGRTAPPGKQMGHAGAIITNAAGTAAEKIAAFAQADVPVAEEPSEIHGLLRELLP